MIASTLRTRSFRLALSLTGFVAGCGEPPPQPPPQPTAAASSPPLAPTAAPSAEPPKPEKEANAGPPHWTYGGEEGPAKWGDLAPEYATCKTGASQMPIDFVTKKIEVDRALTPLAFDYRALPLQIFNNGHTVQVASTRPASVTVGGEVWKLAQFHFHSPSEHTVDGKATDLEVHFVHKNDKGEILVVGLFLNKGKENKRLAAVFDNAPAEVGKEPRPVDGVEVDIAGLVPPKARYYTYTGSLTTPPCTEGVRWIVLAPIGEASEAQIKKLRDATHGDTNRPVQPLGARQVTLSG
jgi:carbonic anhydrase